VKGPIPPKGEGAWLIHRLVLLVLFATAIEAMACSGAKAQAIGEAQLPTDWQRFSDSGATIWTPARYHRSTVKQDEIVASYRREGRDDLAELSETGLDVLVLVSDTNSNFILVHTLYNPPFSTLHSLANALILGNAYTDWKLTSRRLVLIGGREAEELVSRSGEVPSYEIVSYVFYAEKQAWFISYASPASLFDGYRIDFERSASRLKFDP
jgi:hypothetical protein